MADSSRVAVLRALLAESRLHLMPCCFDPHSARLVERAGFDRYDAEAARYRADE